MAAKSSSKSNVVRSSSKDAVRSSSKSNYERSASKGFYERSASKGFNGRILKKGDLLVPENPLVGFAICWDRLRVPVDLDLQAVLVNKKGTIVDAVYYNKLSDRSQSVVHGGDEKKGSNGKYNELIWVQTDDVDKDVQLLIFVIAAYEGGNLNDVINAKMHILEANSKYSAISTLQGDQTKVRAEIQLQDSSGNVDAIAILKRTKESTWTVSSLPQCALAGRHFMDILEPTLGDIIRKSVPRAPAKQKLSLPMEKGSIVELPQPEVLKRMSVGVGWDLTSEGKAETQGKGIDLDISAVFFHNSGRDIGAVYFDNTYEYGCEHTGDNETGDGEGDDEVITVDTLGVPAEVSQICFVVNIYSKDVSFELLKTAYCRVFDDSGNDLCRYDLHDAETKSGLLMARLIRNRSKRWVFQALGAFCGGRTWMDPLCMKDLKLVVNMSVGDVQKKGVKLRARQQARPSVIAFPEFVKRKKTAPVKRGVIVAIPEEFNEQRLFVGVGWDVCRTFRRGADLDVSSVFFDTDGRVAGAVYFDNPDQFGVSHSGDNRTGEGDGDDEKIQLELSEIPQVISQVFIVVNCYTKHMTFNSVPDAYCRVVDEEGNELVRYNLDQCRHKDKPGLVLCRLLRTQAGWGFEAVGKFCGGRTWMDPSGVKAMQRTYFLSQIKKKKNESRKSLREARLRDARKRAEAPGKSGESDAREGRGTGSESDTREGLDDDTESDTSSCPSDPSGACSRPLDIKEILSSEELALMRTVQPDYGVVSL